MGHPIFTWIFKQIGVLVFEYYGNWSEKYGIIYNYKNTPNAKRRRDFKRSEIIIGVALKSYENIQGVNFDDVP